MHRDMHTLYHGVYIYIYIYIHTYICTCVYICAYIHNYTLYATSVGFARVSIRELLLILASARMASLLCMACNQISDIPITPFVEKKVKKVSLYQTLCVWAFMVQ